MTARITNFEIYGEDPETLATFYREVLGWRIERAEGVDYWRIHIDAEAAPLIRGGLARPPGFAGPSWMMFVEVGSVEATAAAAERFGGSVLKAKTAVPRTAWHCVIADPASNPFLVWEPDPLAFPPPEPN